MATAAVSACEEARLVGLLPWTIPAREELIFDADLLPKSEPLSFGIELEFFVMTSYNTPEIAKWRKFYDQHTIEQYHYWIRKRMIMIPLIQAGIMVVDLEDVDEMDHYTLHNYWILKTDSSIEAYKEEPDREHEYVGMELSSPPLGIGRKSLEMVQKVCDTVIASGGHVNESCGLHVHVGNLSGVGFSLKTMKLLAHITTVASEQLNQLHSPDRIINPCAASPAVQFATQDVFEIADIIESIDSFEQFLKRFHVPLRWQEIPEQCMLHHRHAAVNYTPMKGPFNTIEFRAHTGTLDFNEVARWIRTVVVLIRKSSVDRNPYVEITKKIKVSNEGGKSYNVFDLFADLNVTWLVDAWIDDVYWHGPVDPTSLPTLCG